MMKRFLFLFFVALVLIPAPLVLAGDIQFEVTVERTRLGLGESTELNLTFHGTQSVAAPKLEQIDGFEVRYRGPSTMVSIVKGVVSSSITHVYTLIPLKTGTFTIGPFSVDVSGKTLTAKPITIEVISSTAANAPTGQGPQQEKPAWQISEEELKDRIFLTLSIDKKKIYLNEAVPVVVKLYVNRLAVRDIQPPVLEVPGVSLLKFEPVRQYQENLGGLLYDVIEYSANLVALKTGDFTLGPAKINCNLVLRRAGPTMRRNPFDDEFFKGFFPDDIFNDFFDRYESYPLELKSPSLPITVLHLPEEERPEDFEGALGDFQMTVEANPLQVRSGDPITLKMTIKGQGNFDTVRPPKLKSTEGFKVYEPQLKVGQNEKVFEQVLIPESEKVNQIPEVSFSYFNTQKERYQTITQGPIPIVVTPNPEAQTKLVEASQAQTKASVEERLGKDILYLKGSLGNLRRQGVYFYRWATFWIFNVAVLFLFLGIYAFGLWRQRLVCDEGYARRLRAQAKAKKGIKRIEDLLRKGKKDEFFDVVFKTLREYLADRFGLSVGGITLDTIEVVLKEKKVSAGLEDKLRMIFADCDLARYAPAQFDTQKMQEIIANLKEVINYLEKAKV